jgi:hypothetical protein
MMAVDENWRTDLKRWLAPSLTGLSHPAFAYDVDGGIEL